MSPTVWSLTGFIAWALALLVLMEAIRAGLVLSRRVPADGFDPANSRQSPFMQRLARAHANCLEGLPIFGGLMLVAIVTERTAVTDSLASALLVARIAQSSIHLVSVSRNAITLRFAAFTVQMAIAVVWTVRLLTG